MKGTIIVILSLFLIALSFLWWRDHESPQLALSQEMPRSVSVNLNSENKSGATGRAIIEPTSGGLSVRLELQQVTALSTITPLGDSEWLATIKRGSCAFLGQELFSLNPFQNGESLTLISTTMEELGEELPLAIAVQGLVDEAPQAIACGRVDL